MNVAFRALEETSSVTCKTQSQTKRKNTNMFGLSRENRFIREAVQSGDVEQVKRVLNLGVDVNEKAGSFIVRINPFTNVNTKIL